VCVYLCCLFTISCLKPISGRLALQPQRGTPKQDRAGERKQQRQRNRPQKTRTQVRGVVGRGRVRTRPRGQPRYLGRGRRTCTKTKACSARRQGNGRPAMSNVLLTKNKGRCWDTASNWSWDDGRASTPESRARAQR